MRVIAGQFKGRRLRPVPGKNTRPTSDKVKEATFHRIGPFFSGGRSLDLFAGSGALGIESLSRGMNEAVFVENDGKAIRIIYENIKSMNLEKQVEIMRMDAHRALQIVRNKKYEFDLIIMDPPYKKGDIPKLIDEIIQANLLTKQGMIVCEHDPSIQLNHDELTAKEATYGSTAITIFKKNEN